MVGGFKWTREAVVARLDRLWKDINSADITRARTILGRILGPAQVELTDNGQAWRLTFAGNPLALFIGFARVSFRGSGGVIPRKDTGAFAAEVLARGEAKCSTERGTSNS